MAYETEFAIRNLAINAVGWTDVQGTAVLPIACNQVVILNLTGSDVYLRSDPGNSASQVTVHTGQAFDIGAHAWAWGARFPLGCPAVCSLMAATGSPNVIVESIR